MDGPAVTTLNSELAEEKKRSVRQRDEEERDGSIRIINIGVLFCIRFLSLWTGYVCLQNASSRYLNLTHREI